MNGYYSFQLRVPQVVTLTYNLSVEIKQVDVDALNGTILETIYPNSDDQITGKSVGLQSGQISSPVCSFKQEHSSTAV